jgi:Ca2+-binding RTX toxin-like protein
MPSYSILPNYNSPTPFIDVNGNAFQGAQIGPLILATRIKFDNLNSITNPTFDTFIVNRSAELRVTDDTAVFVNSSLMTNLNINGSVLSKSGSGILVFANGAATTNISVGSDGDVFGSNGIAVYDDTILTNAGYIAGERGIIAVLGNFVLLNTGVVTGNDNAIDLGFGGSKVIENDGGLIVGDLSTSAGGANDPQVAITNKGGGAIYGVITLSGGADIVDTRLGILETRFGVGFSTVSMGAGDDQFLGGASRDFVSGEAGTDTLYGGAGDDSLSGQSDGDFVFGEAGDDSVSGGAGDDRLEGGSGDDQLYGGSGGDQMLGGDGNDLYYVDADALSDFDSIVETNASAAGGIDTLFTARGGFTLSANVENMTLLEGGAIGGFGNDLANVILGNTNGNNLEGRGGNDTIDGGSGVDTMRGGLGNDLYAVRDAGDLVVEVAGQGIDRVNALVSYTLAANVETLVLYGPAIIGRGNDLANTIVGNSQGNNLQGAGGNDQLFGDAGADFLRGGLGADTLTGGTGADGFVFDTAFGSTNIDTVKDFIAADDTIWLDNAVFTRLGTNGVLNATLFKTIGAGGVLDANDLVAYDVSTGRVYYDQNGTAAGGWTLFATLETKPAISAADFTVF